MGIRLKGQTAIITGGSRGQGPRRTPLICTSAVIGLPASRKREAQLRVPRRDGRSAPEPQAGERRVWFQVQMLSYCRDSKLTAPDETASSCWAAQCTTPGQLNVVG